MGKGKQWGGSWSSYGSGSDYWPPAQWKQGWTDQDGGKPKKDPLTMNYNQMVVQDTEKDKHVQMVPGTSSTPGTLTQSLQKTLNASRKASARLHKLQGDKVLAQKKWKVFEGQIKALFCKQKQQFDVDIDKLDTEIEQAEQAAIDMEMRLRSIITEEGDANIGQVTKMEREEEDPWMSLMQGEPEPDDQEIAEKLHQAMLRTKDVQMQAQARLLHLRAQKSNQRSLGQGTPGRSQPTGVGIPTYGPSTAEMPTAQIDPYHLEGGAALPQVMVTEAHSAVRIGMPPLRPPRGRYKQQTEHPTRTRCAALQDQRLTVRP